jgi:hypothetical protein
MPKVTQRYRWGPTALPLFLRKHILTSNPQKTYPHLRMSFWFERTCSIEHMFLAPQGSVFVAARPADQEEVSQRDTALVQGLNPLRDAGSLTRTRSVFGEPLRSDPA